MISVMAKVALHNLFLDLQKASKLYSGSAFHRNESWLKKEKEIETLVTKESPVTYPETMLSMCQNLYLVDFYLWRSVAFIFYLFPCARLCNPMLEVAMLWAVVGPCDLLGSFPNQVIPWSCETVWKHGWQFWVWHMAPESDSSGSQKPVGSWAGRELQKGSKISCLDFEEHGWWSALQGLQNSCLFWTVGTESQLWHYLKVQAHVL